MNLKDAADAAKQHITEQFASETPRNLRLESWLYDDHLMVWSLTIGFARGNDGEVGRVSKLVRFSEANRSVLSVGDP